MGDWLVFDNRDVDYLVVYLEGEIYGFFCGYMVKELLLDVGLICDNFKKFY